MKSRLPFFVVLGSATLCVFAAGDPTPTPAPAPATDRVGFPKDYATKFTVLRTVARAEKAQVVTVYGNGAASSVIRTNDLPYPAGAVIVMETAAVEKDAAGKTLPGPDAGFRKAAVSGLHVMRKGKGFGEAYADNRSGEWEYAEYKPDGTYITAPKDSATCSKCHIKAGPDRDFVYQARFGSGK